MEEARHYQGGMEEESGPGVLPSRRPGSRRRAGRGAGTDARIRELIRDHPRGATADEVGKALSLGRSTARRHLDALARAGELVVETYGQTRVFSLPRQADLASVIRRPAPLVLTLSPNLRVLGANEPLLRVFGLRGRELVGKQVCRTPLALILGERVLGEIRRGRGEAAGLAEVECLVGDGRYIFRAALTPLSGPRGPAGTVLSLEDITGPALHRRSMGDTLDAGTLSFLSSNPRVLEDILRRREEEERLRVIGSSVDQAAAALLWIGRDGRLLRANPAALRLLGCREEELGGMTFPGLGVDMPPGTWDALWGALEIRPEAAFGTAFRTGGGGVVPVEVRVSRVRHGDQEFGLVTAIDISHRREQEEALRGSEASLKEANRRLNLLAALTRHDALNDIAALGMYLALMESGAGAAGPSGVSQKMAAVLESLRRRLEFTREYAGLGVASSGWEDLATAVRNGIAAMDTGRLRIDLDLPALGIYRDSLFGRAMANLVSNTLRHGEHATFVRFRARVEGGTCTLLVEDDGVGIAPGSKEAIFRQGYGRDLGHGLFLVREILGITGMEIRETGEPGKGARFEIRIPPQGFRSAPVAEAARGLVPGSTGPLAGPGRAETS